MDAARERFGRVDLHHLNAGISGSFAPMAELTPEEFDEVIAVNLRGTGPGGASGTALVLAALCLPAFLVGAPAAALAPCAAAPLAAIGLGSAAAALGAARQRPRAGGPRGRRWAWMLAASLALGTGPDLGIAASAPDGWAPRARRRHVLGPC